MLATEVKDSLSHYNFFRKKSKLGAVTDVNVKFPQGTSVVDTWQNRSVVKCNMA